MMWGLCLHRAKEPYVSRPWLARLQELACALHRPASSACSRSHSLWLASIRTRATQTPTRARAAPTPRSPRPHRAAVHQRPRIRPTPPRAPVPEPRTACPRAQAAARSMKVLAAMRPRFKSVSATWTRPAAASTGTRRVSTSRKLGARRRASPMPPPMTPPQVRASRPAAPTLAASAPAASVPARPATLVTSFAAPKARAADTLLPSSASARSMQAAATASGHRPASGLQRVTATHAPATTAARPRTTRAAVTRRFRTASATWIRTAAKPSTTSSVPTSRRANVAAAQAEASEAVANLGCHRYLGLTSRLLVDLGPSSRGWWWSCSVGTRPRDRRVARWATARGTRWLLAGIRRA